MVSTTRAASRRRCESQQRAHRLGLDRDQAHVVRQHVVQLAGDPDALGGGAGGGL
jgi:hypothetical protein